MSRPVPEKEFSPFAIEKKWQEHWNRRVPIVRDLAAPPSHYKDISGAIHEDILYRYALMRSPGFRPRSAPPPFRRVPAHGDSENRIQSLGILRGTNVEISNNITVYSHFREAFGSDALRFSLATHPSSMPEHSRLKGSAALIRKLWNAFRYSRIHLHGDENGAPAPGEASDVDRWFLNRLNTVTAKINDFFDHGVLSAVSAHIERLIRHDFSGWYLEWIRGDLDRLETRRCLRHCILHLSHLIHPLMPHISEEIHSGLATNGHSSLLMLPYPEFRGEMVFPLSHKDIEALKELIRVTRRISGLVAGETKGIANVTLQGSGNPNRQWLLSNQEYFLRLSGARTLTIQDHPPKTALKGESNGWTIWIPIQDPVTLKRIVKRLRSRNESLSLRIHRMQRKLNDRDFLDGVSGNTSLRWKRNLQTRIQLREKITRSLALLERQNGNCGKTGNGHQKKHEKNKS